MGIHRSSIDAVCTNSDPQELQVQVINTGISDYTGQLCLLRVPVRISKFTVSTRRHIDHKNLTQLKQGLASESWRDVLESNQAEEAFNHFLSVFTMNLNHFCPMKKSKTNHKSKKVGQYDEEAVLLRREFLKAEENYRLTGLADDKANAAYRKKSYDQKLKSLRQEKSADLIENSSNKSKAIWDIINSERNTSKKEMDSFGYITYKGKKVTDPKTIADLFNSFFVTIADETLKLNEDEKSVTEYRQILEVQSPLSSWTLATYEELNRVIESLQPKTSAGLDELSSRLLKFCKDELLLPLLHVTNLSIGEGVFPSRMKVAKTIPLHKKNSKHDIANFRPISLISTVSKVIEKIVLSRIFNHLRLNNLLTDKQHGFVKGRSTMTALTDLFEYVVDNIETGNSVVGTFLDLSKAFDCLCHDLLLAKLEKLGFQDTALQWFASYLKNRSQVVEVSQKIGGVVTTARSDVLPVTRGVPQGSVLGPVLFVLYTNDLPTILSPYCNTIMYADDSVLMAAYKTQEELEVNAYIAVNIAADYCKSYDLVFNEAKTKQISFGKSKDLISDLPGIQSVHSINYLGVMVEDSLTWHAHIETLCKRLNSAIYAIKRTKAVSTHDASLTAYHALFETHVRYGVAVWGGSSEANIERILILQKKALRIIGGLEPRESCRSVFREWNLLTVVSIYIIECICIATSRMCHRHHDLHTHRTRNSTNFNLPAHRLKLFEKKPTYAGAKFYNALPEDLKSVEPRKLKSHLRSWFVQRPFYKVEEFLKWKDFDFV